MRIHPVLIWHTLLHFFVSVFFFYLVFSFANEDDELNYLVFVYMVCVALFGWLGPFLISKELKVELRHPRYFAGSFIILFSNLFIPYLGLLFTIQLQKWLHVL